MWSLDYDESRYMAWLDSLPTEDAEFVLAVLKSMTASSEHPWYFGPEGVEGVRVRKLVRFGTAMFKALLDSPNGELALVFAVLSPSVPDFQGEIKLLLHGRLKDLSKQFSMEAAAYALLEDSKWQN